jgi:hypothetical protein
MNAMPKCETCGNEYDKAFTVLMNGEHHTFDSFECAIDRLAPRCAHCQCRIIGHGVEEQGAMYCCAHCAGETGETAHRDRSP